MKKTDDNLMLNEIFYNSDNIISKMLKFLVESDFNSLFDSYITSEIDEINSSYSLYRFLNDNEYIRTMANEIPRSDGSWRYNDKMYEISYILLEGNLLLTVIITNSIDNLLGDCRYAYFVLCPNADKFIIQTKDSHKNGKSYINIVNDKGELLSKFYFELPYNEIENLNNVMVKDILPQITIEQLINRYQDLIKSEDNVLSNKLSFCKKININI